jgi:acyl-CoA synthetase (AMP-forming)/AMP-acid ligase II/thioesterase domain-containing protein/acyl carrier protein
MNVEPNRNLTSNSVTSAASQTIWSLLREQAEIRSEATAFIAPGRAPLSFGNLLGLVQRTVQGLRARKILRTDRVAVVLSDGPELAAAFLAVSSGAACAPLNPAYRAQEFEFYLRDLGVRAVIVGAGMDSAVRAVAGLLNVPLLEMELEQDGPAGSFTLTGGAQWDFGAPDFGNPQDTALLLHTSGTTSRPKLVLLTNANLCASARHIRTALSLSPADRCLCVMPLFHIHGLMGSVLSSLSAGASVCFTPGFYAPRFFEWMDQFRPTWFTAVPTMLQSILARAPGDEAVIAKRTLRFIRSSSAPLAPALMARLEATFGVPVVESYGMTEAAHQMASNPLPPGRRKAGSVGLPAGPDIEVMDDSGKPLCRGVVGEVVIRGPNVTSGYENNPVANAEAFTGGWFRTGDRGYLDEEGYLFLTDRSKEIINRGGEKISPREIDEILLAHPSVDQALTFAVPDARLGEEVAAAVVLKPGAAVTEMQLREFAAQQLADFKVPRRIMFLDEIPKGPTGKLQRIGLAEKLGIRGQGQSESASQAFVEPRTAVEKRLSSIFAGILGIDKAGIRDNFFLSGGDSVLAVQLLAQFAAEFGRTITLTQFLVGPTVEYLAQLVNTGGMDEAEEQLVPIQPAGSSPPIFCAQALDGGLMPYANLARYLGPDQPVIGLPQPSLYGRGDVIPIEEQAERHLRAVRKCRPRGPYYLLGWCFGGQLAYEMARQLREQNEEVALVALIDCFNHAWLRAQPVAEASRVRLKQFYRRMRLAAGTIPRQSVGENRHYLAAKWRLFVWAWRKRLLMRSYYQKRDAGKPVAHMIADVEFHNYLTARAYVPGPYPGRVTLFRTRVPREGAPEDAVMGWRDLMTGEVEVVEIPGDHYSALSKPHVRFLGEALHARMLRLQIPARAHHSSPSK